MTILCPRITQRPMTFGGYEMWFETARGLQNHSIAIGHMTMETFDRGVNGNCTNDILMVPFKLAAAQDLLDDLWRAGIRPSNGEGSVGEIGTIKNHLADMRKIAGNKLKMLL